jgi:hypothetical protein
MPTGLAALAPRTEDVDDANAAGRDVGSDGNYFAHGPQSYPHLVYGPVDSCPRTELPVRSGRCWEEVRQVVTLPNVRGAKQADPEVS